MKPALNPAQILNFAIQNREICPESGLPNTFMEGPHCARPTPPRWTEAVGGAEPMQRRSASCIPASHL